jgi:Ca2+-binding EF-hand superfamily protein
LYVIISAVYALLGNVSNQHYNHETLREHATIVFQKFDKLNQGYITIEDFLSFCLKVRNPICTEKKIFFFEIFLGSNDNSID